MFSTRTWENQVQERSMKIPSNLFLVNKFVKYCNVQIKVTGLYLYTKV